MKPNTPKEPEALRSAFLSTMSRVAATVCVVTTSGEAGEKGATVSAMSSVSADGATPTLLICLHSNGSVGQDILRNGTFCVNVLSEKQSEISDVFAGRHGQSQSQRFDITGWSPMKNGAPGLSGSLARLSCRVSASQRVGTHDVIFGAVEEIDLSADGLPLVYACRNYARPAPLDNLTQELMCA